MSKHSSIGYFVLTILFGIISLHIFSTYDSLDFAILILLLISFATGFTILSLIYHYDKENSSTENQTNQNVEEDK